MNLSDAKPGMFYDTDAVHRIAERIVVDNWRNDYTSAARLELVAGAYIQAKVIHAAILEYRAT